MEHSLTHRSIHNLFVRNAYRYIFRSNSLQVPFEVQPTNLSHQSLTLSSTDLGKEMYRGELNRWMTSLWEPSKMESQTWWSWSFSHMNSGNWYRFWAISKWLNQPICKRCGVVKIESWNPKVRGENLRKMLETTTQMSSDQNNCDIPLYWLAHDKIQ